MVKLTKISLLFYLIFLLGILGVMALVNETLNKKSYIDFRVRSQGIVPVQVMISDVPYTTF